MFEYYLPVKWLHVSAVLCSGGLFLARGLAVQAGASWPLAGPARYLSYTLDTVLLITALMLVTLLPSGVFANGWLTAKLGLLAVYIVLGSFALRRGRTPLIKALCFGGALLAYLCILAVARTHDPLGAVRWFSRLAG